LKATLKIAWPLPLEPTGQAVNPQVTAFP